MENLTPEGLVEWANENKHNIKELLCTTKDDSMILMQIADAVKPKKIKVLSEHERLQVAIKDMGFLSMADSTASIMSLWFLMENSNKWRPSFPSCKETLIFAERNQEAIFSHIGEYSLGRFKDERINGMGLSALNALGAAIGDGPFRESFITFRNNITQRRNGTTPIGSPEKRLVQTLTNIGNKYHVAKRKVQLAVVVKAWGMFICGETTPLGEDGTVPDFIWEYNTDNFPQVIGIRKDLKL